MLWSGAKKSLENSVPKEVFGTGLKIEDVIQKWCEKELFGVALYKIQNKQDWTNRGETGLEGGVER